MHVLEKNLRALRGLRYLETQTQMKSFLGMCGVYRRFVADLAKIAKPLTALTSTKLPKRLPPPREEESKAFEELRGRLLAAPILALPRREGRQSRRQGVQMKSDWLFDKPRSNYWLRVAASNLASQSPCLAGVTQSHCNPQ